MADNKEVRTRNKEEHSTVAGVEVVTRRKRRVIVPPIDETPAAPNAEVTPPKVEEQPQVSVEKPQPQAEVVDKKEETRLPEKPAAVKEETPKAEKQEKQVEKVEKAEKPKAE